MNKIIFSIFILLFTLNVYAVLDLELTQGVSKAIPIAITKFPGSDVISNDLQNSGRFRVVAADSAHDYSYWRQRQIDDVVLGTVKSSFGKLKVNFQLQDVYGKSVLLQKQYRINKSQLRALAHHISDQIYKQLTGIRGIFSTKIAYILVENIKGGRVYNLMAADADGYNPKTLLMSHHPIMSPAWSPDGKQIAYVSFENNRAAIYVQDIATGKRKAVSRYPGMNGAPAWAPNGKKLALVLTLTGYPKIYTLNLRTHKIKELTYGSSIDTEPSWSPDGKSLIFTSNRQGSPQIYRLYLKNNKIKRLTFSDKYCARASFTPDGKKIVLMVRRDGLLQIAVQNLASGQVRLLTQFGGLNKSPSIAPNGDMVVYATCYSKRGVLGEVALDGQVRLRLPSQGGEVQEPAWSSFLE